MAGQEAGVAGRGLNGKTGWRKKGAEIDEPHLRPGSKDHPVLEWLSPPMAVAGQLPPVTDGSFWVNSNASVVI
jgi:hypothetical protein